MHHIFLYNFIIIILIFLLLSIIILVWNIVCNDNDWVIAILSCIAIVIIIFCLILHINLLWNGRNKWYYDIFSNRYGCDYRAT